MKSQTPKLVTSWDAWATEGWHRSSLRAAKAGYQLDPETRAAKARYQLDQSASPQRLDNRRTLKSEANFFVPTSVAVFFFITKKIRQAWPILETHWKFNKSINAIGPKGHGLSIEGMADLILQNNIRWDQELLKQIQRYKQDGTIPQLVDKNFSAIALAVSLKAGKITFTNKGTVYEIVSYEDIGEQLDSIMADQALAVCRWDRLFKRIQALNLLGISQPSFMQRHGAPNTPLHLAAQGEEASDCPVQTWPTRGWLDWYEQVGWEQQQQKVCSQHHW